MTAAGRDRETAVALKCDVDRASAVVARAKADPFLHGPSLARAERDALARGDQLRHPAGRELHDQLAARDEGEVLPAGDPQPHGVEHPALLDTRTADQPPGRALEELVDRHDRSLPVVHGSTPGSPPAAATASRAK